MKRGSRSCLCYREVTQLCFVLNGTRHYSVNIWECCNLKMYIHKWEITKKEKWRKICFWDLFFNKIIFDLLNGNLWWKIVYVCLGRAYFDKLAKSFGMSKSNIRWKRYIDLRSCLSICLSVTKCSHSMTNTLLQNCCNVFAEASVCTGIT